MMKSFFTIIATAALLAGTAAHAVTFDFAALAHQEKAEHGREVSFATSKPGGWTVDGVTVFATAGDGAHAFLDGGWWNRFGWNPPSGLGSCDWHDCNGHDKDGITGEERITLTFDRKVRMSSIFTRESGPTFLDGGGLDHTPFTGLVSVNGVTLVATEGAVILNVVGSEFDFSPLEAGDSVYLSAVTIAPIPLPAAGLLLAGGLAGFRFLRRTRGGPRSSPADRSAT